MMVLYVVNFQRKHTSSTIPPGTIARTSTSLRSPDTNSYIKALTTLLLLVLLSLTITD